MDYLKIKKYIAIILTVSVFGLIVALSIFEIVDFDTMHKLANGRLIIENGFTKDCPFNYSKQDCQSIFMVEWLFHVFIFIVYSIGSWNLLVVLQALIVISLFAAIFFHNFKSGFSTASSSIIILIAVLVSMERFMLRADLFAILLAVLFLFFLKKYEASGKNIFLALLILIQIIWANIHGSFPIAYFIILAFLGPHILKNLWEFLYLNRNYFNKKLVIFTDQIKRLVFLFFIIIIVSLINPYGYSAFVGVFTYLIEYGPTLRSQVQEFRSILEPRDFQYFTFKAFWLLNLITLLILALNFKKIKLRDAFLIIGFFYLAITSVRNIALFSVFMAMILPPYLDRTISFIEKEYKRKYLRNQICRIGILIFMIGLILYTNFIIFQVYTNRFYNKEQLIRRFGFGVSELAYPFAAANFIKENDLQGNMFNNFSLGSFLNWKLFPERKTFIDNHTWTVEWFKYYNRIVNGLEPISEIAEKYQINYFILSHLSGDTLRLIEILYNDPNWVMIYFDELAVIFIKMVPENLEIVKNFTVDLESINYNPDKLTFKNSVNFTRGYSNRGIFLANLGFLDQAIYQYKKALETDKSNYGVYHNLGLAYYYLEKYEKAEEAYLKSIKIKPDFAPAQYNLGILYHKTGRIDKAIEKYKKALKINRAYRLANYHLGIIYEEKNNFEQAKKYYQDELKINPNFTLAQNAINRLMTKSSPGQSNLKINSIEKIIEQIKDNPDSANLYFELGVAYGLEQKHDLAFEQFKRAIELNENHFMARFNLANLYSLKEMHEEAKREYLIVIKISPDFADAYLNLGIIYRYYKRDNQKALENWQKFIELSPDDPQIIGVNQEIAQIIKEEMN